MIKTLLAAAAAAAALPALAGEARMSAPIEAGTVASNGVTLVAYYLPLEDESYEVTATWLGEEDAEARRLVMRLDAGDDVTFALPGHLETLYTFSRALDAVTVRAAPAHEAIRNARL